MKLAPPKPPLKPIGSWRWLIPAVPFSFGWAALYALVEIWQAGFVKTRRRSWPIQHIYSASQEPLVYYGALVMCLAWAALCFWLSWRIVKGEFRPPRSRAND